MPMHFIEAYLLADALQHKARAAQLAAWKRPPVSSLYVVRQKGCPFTKLWYSVDCSQYQGWIDRKLPNVLRDEQTCHTSMKGCSSVSWRPTRSSRIDCIPASTASLLLIWLEGRSSVTSFDCKHNHDAQISILWGSPSMIAFFHLFVLKKAYIRNSEKHLCCFE